MHVLSEAVSAQGVRQPFRFLEPAPPAALHLAWQRQPRLRPALPCAAGNRYSDCGQSETATASAGGSRRTCPAFDKLRIRPPARRLRRPSPNPSCGRSSGADSAEAWRWSRGMLYNVLRTVRSHLYTGCHSCYPSHLPPPTASFDLLVLSTFCFFRPSASFDLRQWLTNTRP